MCPPCGRTTSPPSAVGKSTLALALALAPPLNQATFELEDKRSNVTKPRGRFDTVRMMMLNHAAGLLDDFQGAELSRAFSISDEGTSMHTYRNSYGTGEDSRRLSEGSMGGVRYFAIFTSPPALPPPLSPFPLLPSQPPPPLPPPPEVSC